MQFYYQNLSVSVSNLSLDPEQEWILSQLQIDFAHFSITPEIKTSKKIQVEIHPSIAQPPWMIPTFASRNLIRYWSPHGHFFKGADQLLAQVNFHKINRTLKVASQDRRTTYEVIYQFLLSSIGEFMEESGFHRLHALGFSLNNFNCVIPLPSGRGKSTFASWLLLHTDAKFFGDETLYTNGVVLIPFPLRRALRVDAPLPERRFFTNKKFVCWDSSRLVTHPQSEWRIFLYSNVQNRFRFFWDFFWGLGNTQMMEYLIRSDHLFGLIQMAISRARVGWMFRSRLQFFSFWESDPDANGDHLKHVLESSSSLKRRPAGTEDKPKSPSLDL